MPSDVTASFNLHFISEMHYATNQVRVHFKFIYRLHHKKEFLNFFTYTTIQWGNAVSICINVIRHFYSSHN